MNDPEPTRPLPRDAHPTEALPQHHCVAGHDQPHNPTWHPTLGLVPSLTSVIFAVVLLVGVFLLEAWLYPPAMGWTGAALAAGLVFSAVVQRWRGHRGWCFVWRTLRWWLGPIGSLVDPLDLG